MSRRAMHLRPWRYYAGRARCALGIHDLRGWDSDPQPDGTVSENIMPRAPRALPGPNSHRRCDFCGGYWRGAYDGLSPFWVRVR